MYFIFKHERQNNLKKSISNLFNLEVKNQEIFVTGR